MTVRHPFVAVLCAFMMLVPRRGSPSPPPRQRRRVFSPSSRWAVFGVLTHTVRNVPSTLRIRAAWIRCSVRPRLSFPARCDRPGAGEQPGHRAAALRPADRGFRHPPSGSRRIAARRPDDCRDRNHRRPGPGYRQRRWSGRRRLRRRRNGRRQYLTGWRGGNHRDWKHHSQPGAGGHLPIQLGPSYGPAVQLFHHGTTALVLKNTTANFGVQKGFLTGTTVNFGWNNSLSLSNAGRSDFNPSKTGNFSLSVTQHLSRASGGP